MSLSPVIRFSRQAVLLLAFLPLYGCGPEVSRDELGEVVFEVPVVPGAEEAYPLPNLNAPAPAATPETPPSPPQ